MDKKIDDNFQNNAARIASIEEKMINFIDISKLEDLVQKVVHHEFENKLKMTEDKIIVI